MGPAPKKNLPELLAPAGNIESFFAALENGDSLMISLEGLLSL